MLVPVSKNVDHNIVHPRRVVVLGSTGSIGCSTLQCLRAHPHLFQVVGLAAGSRVQQLEQQIVEFHPTHVALADGTHEQDLHELVVRSRKATSGSCVQQCFIGESAALELVKAVEADVVVAAIAGFAGLPSVLAAIEAGCTVLLANKESLVCGGKLVKAALTANPKARLLPVDSEHSALFQALQGENVESIQKLILTASGGPFLDMPKEEFRNVKPEQALKHPNWDMGAFITIDSATMMNKALEVIEACWLYDFNVDQVEVLVHPQSIVHSLVEYCDGTQMAQLSKPDMKGAIAYALSYPERRLTGIMQPLKLSEVGSLEFRELDNEKFSAVELARLCVRRGGASSAVLNAAKEVAVNSFLDGAIRFDEIVSTVTDVVEDFAVVPYDTLAELQRIDRQARELTQERLLDRNAA